MLGLDAAKAGKKPTDDETRAEAPAAEAAPERAVVRVEPPREMPEVSDRGWPVIREPVGVIAGTTGNRERDENGMADSGDEPPGRW